MNSSAGGVVADHAAFTFTLNGHTAEAKMLNRNGKCCSCNNIWIESAHTTHVPHTSMMCAVIYGPNKAELTKNFSHTREYQPKLDCKMVSFGYIYCSIIYQFIRVAERQQRNTRCARWKHYHGTEKMKRKKINRNRNIIRDLPF